MTQENWPFIIVRCFGTGWENKDFIRSVFAAQQKYPDLVNEIWFGGNELAPWETNRRIAEENLIFKDECKNLNIAFSYQQGITLNHAPDGNKREHLFSENVWAVSRSGKRCWGLFCANSAEARQYTQKMAEKFLTVLQPASYWPDDDLRMYKKGIPEEVCFCDRCIEKFNQRYEHNFNREQLTEKLFGPEPSAEIRREWTVFNGESLGGFAAVFRAAVDRVQPDCRLGIQTVFSHWQYDGADYKPIIEALAGTGRRPVGVRPGAAYYVEDTPRNMLVKVLGAGEEAARCRQYGLVGQLCYEAENWPHVSAQKSPESQMIECASALASGMDSLALYWGSDKNAESYENYDFYFENLARYKPFFQAIVHATANTRLAGGAIYHGSNRFAGANWCSKADEDELFLMTNALPIVRESSIKSFLILNRRAVEELSEKDLQEVFSGTVLMDTEAFQLLAERFPQLTFTSAIRMKNADGVSLAAGGEAFYECFENKYHALDFKNVIYPQTDAVQVFSSFSHDQSAAGICTVPADFGGTVVITQYLNGRIWSGYRREKTLDALDSAIHGGMPVRLMTDGFAVNILAHCDCSSGKTAGAFLLNLSIGSTPQLELAIRNPAFAEYQLITQGEEPVKLSDVSGNAAEKRFIIPPLRGWQPALICGVK